MSYKSIGKKYMMVSNTNIEKKYAKCVFCGKPILIDEYTTDSSLWAHNASPVKEGYCCGECNNNIVLPYRFANLVGSRLNRENVEGFVRWAKEGKYFSGLGISL